MDLKPIGSTNHITDYADDVSLLIPEQNNADLESKFHNISEWAKDNKLLVNMAKTKELVFRQELLTTGWAAWHWMSSVC